VRKSMAAQLSEFDAMKKSLMRDLQNRCEKVSLHYFSLVAIECTDDVGSGRRVGDIVG
jgi:hypothetical protein